MQKVLSSTTTAISEKRRLLAISALLASVSIVLHPPFLPAVPAPFAPFLFYGLWEIPLVIGLLLYGPKVGIAVTLVNFISLLVFFPGELITGPVYNLAAIYSMMLGIYLTRYLILKRDGVNILLTTGAGILSRVGIMTVVNALALPLAPPIGFSLGVEALPITLFLVAVFNGTVAAYSIPIAHKISTRVTLRVGNSRFT